MSHLPKTRRAPASHNGAVGTHFAVWAPNAAQVFVTGDFNGWSQSAHPLQAVGGSGIWTGFIAKLGQGATCKYQIVPRQNGYSVDKADPYGIRHETAPKTASLVWDLDHAWGDAEWMKSRGSRQKLGSRCPFTKSISVRGCGRPGKTTAG